MGNLRSGWKWFRNIVFFLFALPTIGIVSKKWRNKFALMEYNKKREENPTAGEFTI